MKFHFWLWAVLGALLLSGALAAARADTIHTFTFSSPLSGPGIVNTTTSGLLTYNQTTHTISGSLGFSGGSIFSNLSMNLAPQSGDQYTYLFTFFPTAFNQNTNRLDEIVLNVILNPVNLDLFWAGGRVCDVSRNAGCGTFGSRDFSQVPEGGNYLVYLLGSATLLAGLLVSKRRRVAQF